MKPLWGIDLGGTKIEGIVLESSMTTIPLARLRIPTEQEKGYQHILTRIKHLVEKMKDETGLKPSTIGFGTPGVLDPRYHTLKNSNTVCLNGKPLKKDLEKILGIPVEIANDANCFTLAETRLGAAEGLILNNKMVFGVIMGTGVGGGIVFNNHVWNGSQGIAGEWGHNFLDESGGKCYCGKSGCVETVISGPGTEKFYQSLSGSYLQLPDIVDAYKKNNDVFAKQTMKRLTDMFAKAISQVINILDPAVVIIGGGLSNIGDLYTGGKKNIEKYIFNNTVQTRFLKPVLGDSAGVFGAAMLTTKS
ncbi:MAG: ROK family protein [Bacteroidota bacterium]